MGRPERVHIVYRPNASVFQGDRLAAAFMECFRELGYDAILYPGLCPTPDETETGDNFFLFDFPAFEIMGSGWKGNHHGWVVFYNVALYGYSEHAAIHWTKHWKRWRTTYDGRVNAIFDYDPANCHSKYPRKVPSYPCPPGWHHSLQVREWGHDLYEASFLGWVIPGGRRDKILRPLEEKFRMAVHTRGSKSRTKNPNPMVHVSHELDDQALRTRVFLHIRTSGHNTAFCSARIIQLGLNNMTFVLSEPLDDGPLEDGKHWVTAKAQDFESTIRYYLDHEEERRKIECAGYEFVKYHYRLQDHLEAALKGAGLR